jgi:oligoendopeptidase F
MLNAIEIEDGGCQMLHKTAGTLPGRDEIEAKYKWQLEDIYADEKYWEEDYLKIRCLSTQLTAFKGTLAQSPDRLLQCFQHCKTNR